MVKLSSDAIKRRRIVKNYILEDGITSKAEIRRRLKSDHGIVVGINAVYNDIKNVQFLSPDKVKEFQLDRIASYKRMIKDQEEEIKQTDDLKLRSDLRRTLSTLMKDMGIVSRELQIEGGGTMRNPSRDKVESIKIIFGEPRVVE